MAYLLDSNTSWGRERCILLDASFFHVRQPTYLIFARRAMSNPPLQIGVCKSSAVNKYARCNTDKSILGYGAPSLLHDEFDTPKETNTERAQSGFYDATQPSHTQLAFFCHLLVRQPCMRRVDRHRSRATWACGLRRTFKGKPMGRDLKVSSGPRDL